MKTKSIILCCVFAIYSYNADAQWLLTGNAGTTNSNFLGTTDAKSLKIRTNNTVRINISSNGYVKIGSASATSRLDVDGLTSSISPVIKSEVKYLGTEDVIGIRGISKPSDFFGIGISGEGERVGVQGVAFTQGGGSALDNAMGIYGIASGGGENYGLYGRAEGNAQANYAVYGSVPSGANNWAGFFNSKVYVDELNVGTTQDAIGYKVQVEGKIICQELRVSDAANWPDYVFSNSYNLPSLKELEDYIAENQHLPGIPTADEVMKSGIEIGEMQKLMMEKIEQLTLYAISLNNENKALIERIEKLESDNRK